VKICVHATIFTQRISLAVMFPASARLPSSVTGAFLLHQADLVDDDALLQLLAQSRTSRAQGLHILDPQQGDVLRA
jgi:hypothetical protein